MLAAVVAACLSALTLAPAHAAAYRYWGFYQLTDGAWTYAQKGPDQTVPKDGSRRRLALRRRRRVSTRYPRAVLTFDQVCGSTPAEAGKKRVGLVVDFGRPADAADGATPPEPKALCAVVATDATSSAVLATAGDVRTEKGLVCGVAGYPTSDCGGAVKEVSPEAKAADQPVTVAAPAATPSASATTPPPRGPTSPQRRPRAPRVGAWRHTSSRASSCSRSSPTCSCARVRAPGRTAEEPRPTVTRLPLKARLQHPAAWWLWGLGLATAASRTTNPVLLLLVIGVCVLVVSERHDPATVNPLPAFLVIGAVSSPSASS